MKFLLATVRFLYLFYALSTFILIMLIVAPLVVIASFFGKLKGGNVIYRLCTWWADAWFFMIGIRHRNIYEFPHEITQQYIFLSNHISYLDAPILVASIRQPLRVLGKAELSKIPVFGYIYRKAIVTVDRSSALHRSRSVRTLKSILKRKISIFIFPEGTFNETGKPLKEFYDGAFRIAIETGTPLKPVIFLDAYDRMHYSSLLTVNPGISRSVFLEPVSVEGLTVKDVPELRDRVFRTMEQACLRYGAGWIDTTALNCGACTQK